MPSHYRIGDARLVDEVWEGWANEWVPLDRFPMPAWAVQISVNPMTAQVIFQDENGDWSDVARNPIRQSEQPTEGTIRTLPDGRMEVFKDGNWTPGTYVSPEEGETPEERAERERNLLEAAREIIRTVTGRDPTEAEDQQLQHILDADENVLQEAKRLAALGVVPVGPTTEKILYGAEAMAVGAGEGERAIVTFNPDGSIRNIDLEDAPESYFEAEGRREEARQIAKKSRSAEEQFDAALDAGDVDKARLIRNFLDEPSEWQIELLKMEYADNLPALKILFDYVDAIGRADVIPEDARALVEQPATPSGRQKMVDPVGWAATQPPGTFSTQGPPGFGGISPDWMGATEATAAEQAMTSFGRVGDVPPAETPGEAWRRMAPPDPSQFIPGEMYGSEMYGKEPRRHRETPIPGSKVLSATDMADPLFQSSLQTTKGTEKEPVVHLLVDGIHTPIFASQYADFVRQATSNGQTVEVPNRETGVFDTVSVGADGSIQSRPDDGSIRFGPTGERFVVPQRSTADQMSWTGTRESEGVDWEQFKTLKKAASQAAAGRPEGLPFTVTQEIMDNIQAAKSLDLARSEPDYGSVFFVNPGGLSTEKRISLTGTVTAEIETSARNWRNKAFYLRERAGNYARNYPDDPYGDQLLREADELEARAAEREKNAPTEIRERLAEASKSQMGTSSWSTEADIEEFKKQNPGFVEAYRTDPRPVKEPTFGPSRAEREASFIKEAQAFAPPATFKKTLKPFGTPRFVTA
jgi:hypothetical protein